MNTNWTKQTVDRFAHDYRDIAMDEDSLAVMLYNFAQELEEAENEALKNLGI